MNVKERKAVWKAQAGRGIEGGRPPQFPPCSLRLNNVKLRHRFYDGVCRCGVVNVPKFYKFEDLPEGRVWFQKAGKDWKRI